MKFRYYITNTFEGQIEGTNDEQLAQNLSGSEDFFVLDSELAEWICADGSRVPVVERNS